MHKSQIKRKWIQFAAMFFLIIMAYWGHYQYANIYYKYTTKKINRFVQDLKQTGMPSDQIVALSLVLDDMRTSMLNHVSSEVANILGVISLIGIFIVSDLLALEKRIASQKNKEDCPPSEQLKQ